MVFHISASRVKRWMSFAIVALLLLHIAGRIVRFGFGYDHALGFVGMFNLCIEDNVPTLYSGVTMVAAAALCFFIGRVRRRKNQPLVWYWYGLAGVMFLAALDEALGLHEGLSDYLHNRLHTTGVFYYPWVAPYAGLCVVGGLIFWKFFRQLPRTLSYSMFWSAGVFVTGALGLEAWSGYVASGEGVMNFYYLSVGAVEEILEMVGVMIFIVGLLRYIEAYYGPVRIVLTQESKENVTN